jgi:hypothetical protein
MIGEQDLFVSFTVSDSGMHKELGRRTRHAILRSGAVVFQMDSRGVLRMKNVLWVP